MPALAYMIDARHNLKDPLEDLIQATDQIQDALAQGLCVDGDALAAAQQDATIPPAPPRCSTAPVPDRRPATRRRGPPSQRWCPRPAVDVPRCRLPSADDRRTRCRGGQHRPLSLVTATPSGAGSDQGGRRRDRAR